MASALLQEDASGNARHLLPVLVHAARVVPLAVGARRRHPVGYCILDWCEAGVPKWHQSREASTISEGTASNGW